MFGKNEVNFDKVDTLIGKNTNFAGEIQGSGTIRIDGSMEGKISTKGDIVIGEEGKVKADIEAQNILVAGMLEGNVYAVGKLEITKNARILGDIRVANLSVEEGATIQGNCIMQVVETEKSRQKEYAG